MKEIWYNVNNNVNRGGERKGDCERREGAARTRKRCAFKDSASLMCRLSPRFQAKTKTNKNSQKDHVVFVGPLPRRGLMWLYTIPPSPLNGPRGLCTVPN